MHAIETAWRRAATDVGLVAWTANPRTWTLTRLAASDDALLGFPRRAWRSRGFWLDRVVPDDRAAVAALFTALAHGETGSVLEYKISDSAGRVRWIRTAGLPATDARRELAGVHLDVTGQHAPRAALADAERRYELATRLGGVSLCEYDPFTHTVRSDPVLLRLLGLDPAAPPMADEWLARIHPDDRERVVAHARRVLEGKPPAEGNSAHIPRMHLRVRDARGEWHWLSQAETVVHGGDGKPRLAAVVSDVTAEMHERFSRRQAEQLYREVWDSIPGSAVALDATGRIVEANPAWYETARTGGGPLYAFVGDSYLEATRRAADAGDLTAARALEGITAVLRRREKRVTLEYECHVPEHGDRWFRMHAFALRRPAYGAIVIYWDITERKISELAIQRGRDHLADMQRRATMSELATSIAHELNQPLATIMAAASTARRQLRVGRQPELKAIVEDIMEATARAAEVMRRARAMIRRDTRLRETLTLNEIVTAVARLVASDLVIHQVTLSLALSPDLPPIVGDRIQLQQVLLNLLLNAIDAVGGQPRQERCVSVVTTHPAPGQVELVVADSGRGVAPDFAGQIFDPFTTTKPEGTGLGLAIVRAIVEAHGGRVVLESPTESGAAFRVRLPYETAEVPEVPPHVPDRFALASHPAVASVSRR